MLVTSVSCYREPVVLSNAGTWRLASGRAVTLLPKIDAKLTATAGGLWVTMSNASCARALEVEDIFLEQGGSLHIPAGAMVVMEAWGTHVHRATYFAWDAITPALALPVCRTSHRMLSIAEPWHDLLQGIAMTAHAAWRLLCGLLGYPLAARGLAECANGPAQV